jgi:uncharacterized membrane protein YcaP (DUF421 family)
MEALREHGVDDLKGVRLAVLETNGAVSIVPADAPVTRTRHPMTSAASFGLRSLPGLAAKARAANRRLLTIKRAAPRDTAAQTGSAVHR